MSKTAKTKNVDRVKGNVKPSSSARAAALLTSSGQPTTSQVGFVGFDAFSTSNDDETGQVFPDEFKMAFRKSLKRDCTTKQKALKEIDELITSWSHDKDVLLKALECWPKLYARLGLDADFKVRENAHQVTKAFGIQCGKNLAPHLKFIIPVLFAGQHDAYRNVMKAAHAATESMFPDNAKRIDVLKFCSKGISQFAIDTIFCNISNPISAQLTLLTDTESESTEERQIRLQILAFLMLAKLFGTLPRDSKEFEQLSSCISDQLLDRPQFWKQFVVTVKELPLKNAVFELLASLVTYAPICETYSSKRFLPAAVNNLDSKEDQLVSNGFRIILACVKSSKANDAWEGVSFQKAVLPKLGSLARHACYQNAARISTFFVAVMELFPATESRVLDLHFVKLCMSLLEGFLSTLPTSSRDPRNAQAMQKAYFDCVTFALLHAENIDIVAELKVFECYQAVLSASFVSSDIIHYCTENLVRFLPVFPRPADPLSTRPELDPVFVEAFQMKLEQFISGHIAALEITPTLLNIVDFLHHLDWYGLYAGWKEFVIFICSNILLGFQQYDSANCQSPDASLRAKFVISAPMLLLKLLQSVSPPDSDFILAIETQLSVKKIENVLVDLLTESDFSQKLVIQQLLQVMQLKESLDSEKFLHGLLENSRFTTTTRLLLLNESKLVGDSKIDDVIEQFLTSNIFGDIFVEMIRSSFESSPGVSQDLDKQLLNTIDVYLTGNNDTNKFVAKNGPEILQCLITKFDDCESENDIMVRIAKLMDPVLEHAVNYEHTLSLELLISLIVKAVTFSGGHEQAGTRNLFEALWKKAVLVLKKSGRAGENLVQMLACSIKQLMDGVDQISIEKIELLGVASLKLAQEIIDGCVTDFSYVDNILVSDTELGQISTEISTLLIESGLMPVRCHENRTLNSENCFENVISAVKVGTRKLMQSLAYNIFVIDDSLKACTTDERLHFLAALVTYRSYMSLATYIRENVCSPLVTEGMFQVFRADPDIFTDYLNAKYTTAPVQALLNDGDFTVRFVSGLVEKSRNLGSTWTSVLSECLTKDSRRIAGSKPVRALLDSSCGAIVAVIEASSSSHAEADITSTLREIDTFVIIAPIFAFPVVDMLSLAWIGAPNSETGRKLRLYCVLRLAIAHSDPELHSVAFDLLEKQDFVVVGSVSETINTCSAVFDENCLDLLVNVTCLEFFTSQASNFSSAISTQADLMLCCLVSYCQDLTTNFVLDDLRHESLIVALAKYFLACSKVFRDMESRDRGSDDIVERVTEWKEVFLPSAGAYLVNIFVNYAQALNCTKLSSTIVSHQIISHLAECISVLPADILLKAKLNRIFSPQLDELGYDPELQTLILTCSALLVNSRLDVVKFASYRLLYSIIPNFKIYECPSTNLADADEQEVRPTEEPVSEKKLPSFLIDAINISQQQIENLLATGRVEQVQNGSLCCGSMVSFFLAWKLLMRYMEGLSSQEKACYFDTLHRDKLIDQLILTLFLVLPEKRVCDSVASAKVLFNANTALTADLRSLDFLIGSFDLAQGAVESQSVSHVLHHVPKWLTVVACELYYRVLKLLPGAVRLWWHNQSKKTSRMVENFTQANMSAILAEEDLSNVAADSALTSTSSVDTSELTVQIRMAAKELIVTYTFTEMTIELLIRLRKNYPLNEMEVDEGKRVGVQEKQWRRWMFQLNGFLKSGSLVDGLVLWRRNLDKHMQGVEECMICFAAVHGSNYQLPKIKCKQCKKRFHGSCLYKWFSTSNNTTCPLCRTPMV